MLACRLYQTALVGLVVVVPMFLIGACSQGLGSAPADEEITLDCNGVDRAIVFAGLDWNSAQINNHIAGRILQDGFGCKFEDTPGSTVPLIQGLVRGEIDIVMEIWVNTAPDTYHEAVTTGDVIDLGPKMSAGEHSFLVPRYVIEGDAARGIQPMAPDLRTVADLPKYSSVFHHSGQPGQGRYYNCPVGWQCEEINTDKLATYGLDISFTNFRPEDSGALVSSLRAAYERGEPWLGYYWWPTWVLGSFDMVVITEPEYSEDCWVDGNRGCAYPTSPVNVAISKGFSELAAEPMLDFLRAYEMDHLLMSAGTRRPRCPGAGARPPPSRHALAERVDRPLSPNQWIPLLDTGIGRPQVFTLRGDPVMISESRRQHEGA